jgi:endonuclease/exonuclease/phosphatase family metal-dependent hydrolase
MIALALGASIMASSIAASSLVDNQNAPPIGQSPGFDGTLSVMTYNIHGVPWPVDWGRPAELLRIAETLRGLRSQRRNPHIVVLQEAFTQDAQAIGREAGYPYIAEGPSLTMTNADAPTSADRKFASQASWAKGEGMGKYVGSGLQILSDYPIVGLRRMVYPAFACAGYDCLANKGAMLASIALPDRRDPIDIVTTHLNSRHASGVPEERSIFAFRRQLGCLTDFIRAAHDQRRALIVAGDFNVGKAETRRAELLKQVRARWVQHGDIDDVYGEATRMGMQLSADARFSHRHARDWEFFTPGRSTDLELIRLDVPFGHSADGSMLSDHVGYTALFALSRTHATGPTSDAKPIV